MSELGLVRPHARIQRGPNLHLEDSAPLGRRRDGYADNELRRYGLGWNRPARRHDALLWMISVRFFSLRIYRSKTFT